MTTAILILFGFVAALGFTLVYLYYILPNLKKPMDEPVVTPPPIPVPETPQNKLFKLAVSCVGEEITPADKVPDEVACAEVLSTILNRFTPPFPYTTSTVTLYQELRKNPAFKGTLDLRAGNIIVSPTGSGNGTIIGHCGIIGDDEAIYSNDSRTGLWSKNYTIASWIKRYRDKGALKIYIFEPVSTPTT